MTYCRATPSPRYQDLITQYRRMHEEGEAFLGLPAEKTFPGLSLPPQATRIKRLIDQAQADTLLDYGCGKGKQYDPNPIGVSNVGRFDSILDYWDVAVHCYDPAFRPFSDLPAGRFDGVISTDVLEHCPEEDIPWIVDEMFGFAKHFVFANVACYPAKKRLPTGENAHITIRPAEWWRTLLSEIASKYPDITWEVWIQHEIEATGGRKLVETRIGN